jgi:colicin import membrane protein
MLHTITRSAVDVWSRAARLPLRAAEVIARPEDAETWRPSIVFERTEASVRRVIGDVLGDEQLKASAARQRTRVTQLEEAVRKRAQAEVLERRADERLRKASTVVSEERAQAHRRAETKAEAAERREAAKRAKAEKDAAKRKEAIAKAADAHERQLEHEEADAERARLAKEAEALKEERAALAAESEALRLEDAAEKVKARRKPAI